MKYSVLAAIIVSNSPSHSILSSFILISYHHHHHHKHWVNASPSLNSKYTTDSFNIIWYSLYLPFACRFRTVSNPTFVGYDSQLMLRPSLVSCIQSYVHRKKAIYFCHASCGYGCVYVCKYASGFSLAFVYSIWVFNS